MKTLTITLHNTDNCGSSLQAFALQHFLITHGIDNEIIDYVPAYTQNNGSPFKTFVRNIVFRKSYLLRRKKFQNFINKNLKLTKKRYKTYHELEINPPQADIYITGSDQLWNNSYACGNDPAFYLGFVNKENINKISYAVSIGKSHIKESDLELVKEYGKNFKWISLREKINVGHVQKVVNKVPVVHVCDPVLLNDAREYDKIKKIRIIKDKYILVYVAQAIDKLELNRIVKEIAKNGNLKIVFIGTYRSKCDCDFHIKDMDPGDFLSLIYNAEYIISNSFHATIFSLIYNKQFLVVLPKENGNRISEILELTNLENHVFGKFNKIPYITKDQFIKINDVLDHFKKKSQEIFLDSVCFKQEII